MAKKTYIELLRDPRWQKRRLEIFERDEWKCTNCDDKTKNLQVNHKQYRYGAKPWEYEDWELETLCEDCHGRATKQSKLLKSVLPNLTLSDADVLLGFAMALIMHRHGQSELLDVGGDMLTAYGAAAFICPRKSVFDAVMAGERDVEKLKQLARAESPGCFDDLETRLTQKDTKQ